MRAYCFFLPWNHVRSSGFVFGGEFSVKSRPLALLKGLLLRKEVLQRSWIVLTPKANDWALLH
jgi:hypothetical protein